MTGDPQAMSLREYQERAVALFFGAKASDEELGELGPPERWRIYRNMVRRRLSKLIRAALPRTVETLGEEAFNAHITAYFDEAQPRERYFREVPVEFAAFCAPRLDAAAQDLLRYEVTVWRVRYLDASVDFPVVEFAFDKAPVISPMVQLIRVSHTVNKRGEETTPGERNLAVYRRANNKAATWELNDMAAALLEAWIPGDRTMTECVQAVTAARGSGIDEQFLEKLSALLADFIERGVLLGSRG